MLDIYLDVHGLVLLVDGGDKVDGLQLTIKGSHVVQLDLASQGLALCSGLKKYLKEDNNQQNPHQTGLRFIGHQP